MKNLRVRRRRRRGRGAEQTNEVHTKSRKRIHETLNMYNRIVKKSVILYEEFNNSYAVMQSGAGGRVVFWLKLLYLGALLRFPLEILQRCYCTAIYQKKFLTDEELKF